MTDKRDTTDTVLLPRGSGVSVWRQIAERVEADILAGALAPHARLPNEVELSRRYAVNRHTVRRALAALATKGLIRATPGRGTFVEPPRLPYRIGPRTRFSEAAARAGREAAGDLLAATAVEASPDIAERLGLAPDARVLRLSTRRLADGIPIVTGTSWFPLPRFAALDGEYAAHGSISRAIAACGVADYRRAETRVTARLATAEESSLLMVPVASQLLVLDSLNVDEAGTPIQYARSLFAADRVELVVS
jgi:GntR family phosphonate transport system transcriptional regulator